MSDPERGLDSSSVPDPERPSLVPVSDLVLAFIRRLGVEAGDADNLPDMVESEDTGVEREAEGGKAERERPTEIW